MKYILFSLILFSTLKVVGQNIVAEGQVIRNSKGDSIGVTGPGCVQNPDRLLDANLVDPIYPAVAKVAMYDPKTDHEQKLKSAAKDLVELYDQYSKECYSDSFYVSSGSQPYVYTVDKKTGGFKHVEPKPYYRHKQPDFISFIEYLRKK